MVNANSALSLMTIDSLRLQYVNRQINDLGWSSNVAFNIARSLTPFDDKPKPRRALEKQIRARVKTLVLELRALNGDQGLSTIACVYAASEYVAIAKKFNDSYFISFWTRLEEDLRHNLRTRETKSHHSSWGNNGATFSVDVDRVTWTYDKPPHLMDDRPCHAALAQLQKAYRLSISYPDAEEQEMSYYRGMHYKSGPISKSTVLDYDWQPPLPLKAKSPRKKAKPKKSNNRKATTVRKKTTVSKNKSKKRTPTKKIVKRKKNT